MNVAEANRNDTEEEVRQRILAALGESSWGGITSEQPQETVTTQPVWTPPSDAPASATTQSLLDSSAKLDVANSTSEQRQSALVASLSAAAPALTPSLPTGTAAQDFERTSYAPQPKVATTPLTLPQDFERSSYGPVEGQPLALPQDFERVSYGPVESQSPKPLTLPQDFERVSYASQPNLWTPPDISSPEVRRAEPVTRPAVLQMPQDFERVSYAPVQPGSHMVQRAELVKLPTSFDGPMTPGPSGRQEPVGLKPRPQDAPRAQSVEPGTIVARGIPRATPAGTLRAGANNQVDPGNLFSYLQTKFADSGLVGYVPPDGKQWGITTGSAAEWAALGLAVAKQESGFNTKSYNASDPGGSVGLFQFGQGQKQFAQGNQFDPQQSADAFVRSVQHYVHGKGGNSVANLGATFGSIRRPNEAGQYIGYAQDVAARSGGAPPPAGPSGPAAAGGGGGGGKSLDEQINALISADNKITMKKDEDVNPKDTLGRATQQALKIAKSMQDSGVPVTRDQLQTMITSQYSALASQQVEQEKEQRAKQEKIETEQRQHEWEVSKPKPLGAAETDQLSQAQTAFEQIDNLMALHKEAEKNHAGGSWLSTIQRNINPYAIAFDSAYEALVTPTAKGVLGNVGNLSEMEQKMPRSMLPALGDSPEVAQGKADRIKLQIANTNANKIDGYARSRYDVGGWTDVYNNFKTYRDAHTAKVQNAPGVDVPSRTASQDWLSRYMDDQTTKHTAPPPAAAATPPAAAAAPLDPRLIKESYSMTTDPTRVAPGLSPRVSNLPQKLLPHPGGPTEEEQIRQAKKEAMGL